MPRLFSSTQGDELSGDGNPAEQIFGQGGNKTYIIFTITSIAIVENFPENVKLNIIVLITLIE